MKNTIINTILGLALLTAAPSMAQDTASNQADQAVRPAEVQVLHNDADSSQLTLNLTDDSVWILRPQLQRVKDVPFRPRGRSRFDKAPQEKPLIYVDGFEHQWD